MNICDVIEHQSDCVEQILGTKPPKQTANSIHPDLTARYERSDQDLCYLHMGLSRLQQAEGYHDVAVKNALFFFGSFIIIIMVLCNILQRLIS